MHGIDADQTPLSRNQSDLQLLATNACTCSGRPQLFLSSLEYRYGDFARALLEPNLQRPGQRIPPARKARAVIRHLEQARARVSDPRQVQYHPQVVRRCLVDVRRGTPRVPVEPWVVRSSTTLPGVGTGRRLPNCCLCDPERQTLLTVPSYGPEVRTVQVRDLGRQGQSLCAD